jgi:phosphoribosylglycinamide formyltransferase 1
MSIVLMASGNGTNFEAIVKSGIPVSKVITNKKYAKVISRAKWLAIPCEVSEKNYEDCVPDDTKLVVLAGFMRLLSNEFVSKFKVINVHPSLLPSFPGVNAIGQALNAGVKITGCTVHWVDEGIDTGKIIAQTSCDVYDDDDHKSLNNRIQKLEYFLYPHTIKKLLEVEVNNEIMEDCKVVEE